MANYSTNLKTWGSAGSEYPDGYNYIEGEQPVDEWDNFLRYNSIEDVSHLISLTNKRIESEKGTSHPTSPENAHLSYRTDNERLSHYDSTEGSWHGLLKVDGDTLQGELDAGGYLIGNVGKLELSGNVDLLGNDLNDTSSSNTIYDSASGHVPLAILEQSDVTINAGSHLSGGKTVSLGSSLTLNVQDDFLLNTGDSLEGNLDMNVNDLVDGATTIWDSGNGYIPSAQIQGLDPHLSATDNPHGVTAAQAGAVDLAGDTMTGNLVLDGASVQYSTSGASIAELPNSSGSSLNIHDRYNGESIMAFNEGGPVEVINTNFDVQSGDLQVGGNTISKGVPASGQVTLNSGAAVIDTEISTIDATFNLALGVDDPDADTKISGRLFWDDSVGTYHIEVVETDTNVGNPTVNYDVIRVR